MRESFLSAYTSVKAKLSTLKRKYIDGAKEAKEQLAQWERDVERLRVSEEFSQNSHVQALYAFYKEKALDISRKISLVEKLSENDRNVLFARRKEIYGFLRMLGINALKDIESIEKAVDFELDGLDENVTETPQ